GVRKDTVARDVIEMVMRVDDEPNGQICFLADFIKERLRGGDVFERVDNRYAVGTNHEGGVRAGACGFCGRIVNRSPRAITEIVKREGRECLSSAGTNENANRNRERQEFKSHRHLPM